MSGRKLTRSELKALQDALLEAFDRTSLVEMVQLELSEAQNSVSGGAPANEMILQLIGWAERHERIEELIKAARRANPDSSKLREVEAAYFNGRAEIPALSIKELECVIDCVKREALYMGRRLPGSKKYVVNSSNLREELDKHPVLITPGQEQALMPLTIRGLIAMILHDALLARNAVDPDFEFAGDQISGADIVKELKLEVTPLSPC